MLLGSRQTFTKSHRQISAIYSFKPNWTGGLKPLLHNADNDSYVKWVDHFGKSFTELDDDLKDDLVGLVDGDFIYELPLSYYNY